MIILIQVEFQGLSRHGKRTLENYGFFQSFQDIANSSIFCEAIKTKTRLLKTIKSENALFEEAHH